MLGLLFSHPLKVSTLSITFPKPFCFFQSTFFQKDSNTNCTPKKTPLKIKIQLHPSSKNGSHLKLKKPSVWGLAKIQSYQKQIPDQRRAVDEAMNARTGMSAWREKKTHILEVHLW